MLSVTDLLTIQTKPELTDLSLQTIQEFYKENLCDRLFVFELEDTSRQTIKLRFKEDHLCHLLGIHYIMSSTQNATSYAGHSGYNLLRNGTVTFDFLKTTDRINFKSKKNRMLYFPFVYQVLQNPTAIIFDGSTTNTRIDVDIILYNQLNNTYLHLGLDRNGKSAYYYPKSFYDRKKNDHITGQTQITIKSKRIEID